MRTLDEWFRRLYGPDHDTVRGYYEADRTAGFPETRRVVITRKDGSRRIVEFGAAGIDRIICVMHDVTDLAVANEQLQERSELYRIITNISSDGYWVVDREGKIIEVNDEICRILGYNREELLSSALMDIDAVESPEETQARIRNVMEQGTGRFGTRHRRKDGSIIDVEVSTTYQPATGHFMAFIRDITERKRIEKDGRENEERYRWFSSLTSDYVYCCMRQGDDPYRVRWLGGAIEEITGYSPEEIRDRGCWLPFVHPDDQERICASFKNLVPGRTATEEFRLIRKDGTIEGTVQDITKRTVAEKAILKLNKELDERVMERTAQLEAAIREQEAFSYSVSHDLRAPLRHINSFSTILAEEYGGQLPEKARHYLDRVAAASTRMGQLIDDLLELSRVGRTELHPCTINLSNKAAKVVAMYRETEPDRAVECIIADGLTALGDHTLVREVLENLLGNAWKYTARQPHARIEFGRATVDGQDAFFVRDNGVGFDMAYGGKLFRPFQRLHGSEFQGTGIGLATVRRIIERHGGRVWAEGKVNEGATFYFTLPQEKGASPLKP